LAKEHTLTKRMLRELLQSAELDQILK
jgi:hypothetical protein